MLTLFLFLIGAAAALLEASARAYPNRAEWRREARISLILGACAVLVEMVMPDHGAKHAPGITVALALAVFLADDLLYYCTHRLAHRVALFWASHAVHHSPSRYNFFTGLRQPPTWLLTPAAVAPLVLIAVGAPVALVAASAAVRGVHHFLVHTERVRRLPVWVEFIFNTPSHHRVHHATEPGCIDRNFGGVLIIWDRLFGTYAREPTAGVHRYGLLHPTRPSALHTALDPWIALIGSARRAPTLRRRLGTLLGPP
ncbi:sterol desaturase family protein [Terricaulis silvestris]|uniref:Fatty acid hydroxylase superfamily protein n=1 Tax=Terricaulis silvestris TaxID=2686094 RepID=A0A6I6MUY5_9CAUL|nr:sterol desaturase family protein [Terricaulis silvestris]QGZ96254.1 Fatty acid hydroxylase superfamily protein [Terricaulis silvestris]